MDFGDIAAALYRLNSAVAERHPVRVNLTTADMNGLLARYGVEPGPNEVGMHPLASFRHLPVCYGEQSEIMYSDGTVEPLYTSP